MNFADLRNSGRLPRIHPNGFIQFDIEPGKRRLNVWVPEGVFLGSRRHPIHNHSYDIRSTIICGALTNLTYLDRMATEYHATHVLHTASKLDGSNETILIPIAKAFTRLMSQTAVTYGKDESYTLEAETLHDSLPHGLTATIMTIANPHAFYSPMIAVPVGVKPNNDHVREVGGRPMALNLCWNWIEKALGDREIF